MSDTMATTIRARGWQRHHTVITLCIFSYSIFLSMCACVCVCVRRAVYLATWLSSAATFGAELRLYLPTQNTDKVSNLFSPMKGCFCLWQSLSSILSGKQEGQRATANLDSVTGTKNTLFSDDTCSCTRCAMFTLQRTYKTLFTCVRRW